MKWSLLVAVCLLLAPSLASAQTASIGLFADQSGSECNVVDSPGPVIVFMYHLWAPCATGSRFKVVQLNGANLTYLAEQFSFPLVTGTTLTGITITYPQPLSSPIYLGYIYYSGSGMSQPCGMLKVVPHPAAVPSEVLWTDCSTPPAVRTATGGAAVVNPDETCDCSIPVHETTWGHVKALYQ